MQFNHTREAHDRAQRMGGGREEGRAVQQPHTVCKAVFVILTNTSLEVHGDALETDYNPIRGTEELFSHRIHQTNICCSNKNLLGVLEQGLFHLIRKRMKKKLMGLWHSKALATNHPIFHSKSNGILLSHS